MCCLRIMVRGLFSRYRRAPGNTCTSKAAIDDVVSYIDEDKKCKPSKTDIFGIVKEERKEMKIEDEAKKEEQERSDAILKAAKAKYKKKVCFYNNCKSYNYPFNQLASCFGGFLPIVLSFLYLWWESNPGHNWDVEFKMYQVFLPWLETAVTTLFMPVSISNFSFCSVAFCINIILLLR